MQRIVCPERDDWQETATASGFVFHSLDGERYWDESAYYAFSLAEIEQGIEGVTAEIDAMCTELVNRAIADERYLRLLKIPESFWTLITASWKRRDPTLYGRIDLRFDGNGPAKLLEYNADTPTSLVRSRGVPMELAGAGRRAADHSARRGPVQLDPRAPDRGMAQGRRRTASASLGHPVECRGRRHAAVSRGRGAAGRPRHDHARHRAGRPAATTAPSSIRTSATSSSPSSSTPGNGCSAKPLARD